MITMIADNNFIETNRNSWNKRTQEHFASGFYNVKGFLNGDTSLHPLDIDLLGDVKGKKILHLQCHFGMDSISLSRMGAKVTAADLSDEAIAKARHLAAKTGSDAEFICCNIFDLPHYLNDKFDIVYTSYGVINWYPDLDKWGALISRYLKPQGKFVMVEFHPVLWMFDTQFEKIEAAYSRDEPYITLSETYTNAAEKGLYEEVTWNHGLSKVLQALLNHELQIIQFEEYDYSPVNLFGKMTEANGKYRLKNKEGLIPILFSVVAKKQD